MGDNVPDVREDLDFRGQVVIVTGAGRGLGRRYVLDLAARGASTVVCARRPDAALRVAEEARALGGEAVACVAEATDGSAPLDAALAAFGRVDGVIANAGQTRDRSFARMTDLEWAEVLAVHLDGARALCSEVWSLMRSRGSGRIVLTGSGAGLHGNRGQANYAAAKAGILGLAATLAHEGAPHGIGVNVVAPMALTDMTEGVFDDDQRSRLTADRVSPFVLALVHPECPLSGEILEVGGGWAGAVRWERSAGVRFEDVRPSPGEIAARWKDILRFSEDSDHPTSIADSLDRAMGVE